MTTFFVKGCHVLTVNAARDEFVAGHVVTDGNRITAVGPGDAPDDLAGADGARVVDARGCLATPGLINTHHHLYQWATRGLAQQATLFEWLVELYPVWALIDAETPSGDRRARMIAGFNRGYNGFQQTYRTCTPAALVAIRRYIDEGSKISRDLTARYAN